MTRHTVSTLPQHPPKIAFDKNSRIFLIHCAGVGDTGRCGQSVLTLSIRDGHTEINPRGDSITVYRDKSGFLVICGKCKKCGTPYELRNADRFIEIAPSSVAVKNNSPKT